MVFYPPRVSEADLRAVATSPTRIERRIREINKDRYIVDYLFGASAADGGAVLYEKNAESPYLEREAQPIDDGAEFPKLNSAETLPQVQRVQRYGGEVDLTFASIRRRQVGEVQKRTTQLANTVVRKTNIVAVNTIMADLDIPTYGASTDWTVDGADPLADLMNAQSIIDDSDQGFLSNVVLINPQDALALKVRKDVRDALPRETRELNPVLARELSGLLDLEFIKSPFVERGSLWIADRNAVGVVGDEEGGVRAAAYDEQNRHVHVLQAWRTIVPVVTEPFAAVKVTGIAPAGA